MCSPSKFFVIFVNFCSNPKPISFERGRRGIPRLDQEGCIKRDVATVIELLVSE